MDVLRVKFNLVGDIVGSEREVMFNFGWVVMDKLDDVRWLFR